MKLTDWNNLQWESRKLERLLLDYFDDLSLGNSINTGYQTFYFLMKKVDAKLLNCWENDRARLKRLLGDQFYDEFSEDRFTVLCQIKTWKAFFDTYSIYNVECPLFDKLKPIKEFEYPWFHLYCLSRNLHPMDAVRSLALEFEIMVPTAFANCNLQYPPSCELSSLYHVYNSKLEPICTIAQYNIPLPNETLFTLSQCCYESIPLFNLKLLEFIDLEDSHQPPVLLCDSIEAAQKLQRNYTEAFHKQLKEDWIVWWNRKMALCEEAIPPDIRTCSQPAVIRNERTVLEDFGKIVNTLQEATLYYNNPQFGVVAPLLNLICTSWFGSYDLLNYTDWTPLLDRKIFFCQAGNDYRTALEHFLHVYAVIREQQQKLMDRSWQENQNNKEEQAVTVPPKKQDQLSFIFCHCHRKVDLHNVDRNDIKIHESGAALVEALAHNLIIPEILEPELDEQLRILRKHRRQDKRYLIRPIIRKGSFTLLTGVRGNGKSYMAMTLAAAIATKGDLFNGWIVEQKAKVLYVMDSEMAKEIYEERLEVLRKSYSKRGFENFHIESVHGLDLLTEEGRQRVNEMIDHTSVAVGTRGLPVSLVILDHLTKLSDGVGDQKENWITIRKWIEEKTADKIAVMVVQHEYQHRVKGTVLIDNDAETTISVERLADARPTCLKLALRVPRNRSGKDQLTPFIVTLDMAGKPPKWTELSDTPKQSTENYSWKGMSNEDKVKCIMEWSKEMKRTDIASKFNISKSTLEKFLTQHKLSKPVDTHPAHHKHPSRKHLN